MKRFAAVLVFLLLYACSSFRVLPCTTFILQEGSQVYFGRNLDWDWEDGMVLINSRNVHKRSFVATTNAATWTSKYGSVTFNQFGREMAFGGMNEAGLVVENMWLTETQYPPTDGRPEINMLQWIQYQLDNCCTVEQVIETDKRIRLENTAVRARIHYLVCDAQGDCATVEFLNGSLLVHHGQTLPFRALANDPYQPSEIYLRAHPTLKEGSGPLAHSDSMSRFCRAAARAASFRAARLPEQNFTYAFETLDQVRQGSATVWQVVYDLSARQIQFRTISNPRIRRVSLKGLDFSCTRPPQFANIKADPSQSGVLEFHELKEQEHRNYLEHFTAQDSLKQEVGDLTSIVEPLLATLRGYSCAD